MRSLILSFLTLALHLSVFQAVDADLVSNVTYRIKTEAARQLFAVNRLTGAVSVLQALDFEDLAGNSTYTFEVEALDHGGTLPPGTATVVVRITVRLIKAPSVPLKLSLLSRRSLFSKVQQVPVRTRVGRREFSSGLVASGEAGDWIRSFRASVWLTPLAEALLTVFQ